MPHMLPIYHTTDLLQLGLVPSEKPRKRKNAMLLNRKKSRSFSGSLPTIHLQPDEVFGGDDSMDGGGVRRVSAPVTWVKHAYG